LGVPTDGVEIMKIRDLVVCWREHAGAPITTREYVIKLQLYDAARIQALAEMYPARTEAQIITELLTAALDEVEEAFPYEEGNRVIAEDEYQDPVYEDTGPTPQFLRRTREHLLRLQGNAKDNADG